MENSLYLVLDVKSRGASLQRERKQNWCFGVSLCLEQDIQSIQLLQTGKRNRYSALESPCPLYRMYKAIESQNRCSRVSLGLVQERMYRAIELSQEG